MACQLVGRSSASSAALEAPAPRKKPVTMCRTLDCGRTRLGVSAADTCQVGCAQLAMLETGHTCPGCATCEHIISFNKHLLGRAVVLLVEAEVLHFPLVVKVLLRIHLRSTKTARSGVRVMCRLVSPRPRQHMSSVPVDVAMLST